MRHVMVTDAAGSLGRRIVADLLERNCRVTAVSQEGGLDTLRSLADKEQLDLLSCDLADTDAVSSLARSIENLDMLIHLANRPPDDPADHQACTRQANMTIDLISLLGSKIARAIFVSSPSVYGEAAGGAVSEGEPTVPSTYHGASLLASEKLWDLFAIESGKPVTVLRLPHGADDLAGQSQSVLSELNEG